METFLKEMTLNYQDFFTNIHPISYHNLLKFSLNIDINLKSQNPLFISMMSQWLIIPKRYELNC